MTTVESGLSTSTEARYPGTTSPEKTQPNDSVKRKRTYSPMSTAVSSELSSPCDGKIRRCMGRDARARQAHGQSMQAQSTMPSPEPNRSMLYFSISIKKPVCLELRVQQPLQSESEHMS